MTAEVPVEPPKLTPKLQNNHGLAKGSCCLLCRLRLLSQLLDDLLRGVNGYRCLTGISAYRQRLGVYAPLNHGDAYRQRSAVKVAVLQVSALKWNETRGFAQELSKSREECQRPFARRRACPAPASWRQWFEGATFAMR